MKPRTIQNSKKSTFRYTDSTYNQKGSQFTNSSSVDVSNGPHNA